MTGFWKDRSVLVTGSTGFIGSNVTRALVARGANVVCLQRDASRPSAFDLYGLADRTTIERGEMLDSKNLERLLHEREIDCVFHLAAQALAGEATRSPIETLDVNIRGTYLLLDACRRDDGDAGPADRSGGRGTRPTGVLIRRGAVNAK